MFGSGGLLTHSYFKTDAKFDVKEKRWLDVTENPNGLATVECPICLEDKATIKMQVLHEPKDGQDITHGVCNSCYQELIKGDEPKCPECREPILKDILYYMQQKQWSNALREVKRGRYDVNATSINGQGYTPLLYALENYYEEGVIQLVKELIKAGAKVNKADDLGFTPLLLLLTMKDYTGHSNPYTKELIQILLKNGADPLDTDEEYHYSALHWAVEADVDFEIFKIVLAAYQANDEVGWVNFEDVTFNKKTYTRGPNVESDNMIENQEFIVPGPTALHLIAKKKDTVHTRQMIQLLLDRNTSILIAEDDKGFTPFHTAIYYGHINVISAIYDAYKKDTKGEIVNQVVGGYELGEDVLFEKGFVGSYPIHLATRGPSLHVQKGIVRFLLENGARVNAQNADGNTVFHLLGSRISSPVGKLLLEQKPDLSIKNNDGKTAYEVALEEIQVLNKSRSKKRKILETTAALLQA